MEGRKVKYTNDFDGDDNNIVVEEWVGKEPIAEPEFIFSTEGEYYYQIEMVLDDDDKFEALAVKKVGGADCDDARGGEWYEEMDDDDIEMIISYVAGECFKKSDE